ncbi:MAG TPA: hypothetical protein VK021_05930 [Flavobacteriaceae bacterium]|nr:hypothetical protein [Flavobacteriaceae bacterium]
MQKQPKGKFIVNLVGNGKSYFLWNGTESYYKKLRSAYSEILKSEGSEHLFFSFFTLCASTLEYSLNFIIADFCVSKYGPKNYKDYSEGYMGLPFRKKLLMIPLIISNGQYEIDNTHSSFKQLEEMITLRNRILHNKDFLKEFDFPKLNSEIVDGGIIVPLKEAEIDFEFEISTNHIDKLTREKCLKFGDALGDFKKYIMTPSLNNELGENSMIKKQEYVEE